MSFLSSLGGIAKSAFGSMIDRVAGGLGGVSISGNLTVDPAYCIVIQSARSSGLISIIAPLPETFSTNTSSDYDTPFTDGIAKMLSKLPGLSEERAGLGLRMMGAATSTQAMTMQVWQGSAPMEFSIPMHFVLNTDSERDILTPLRQLMSLTLPSSGSFNSLSDLANLDITTGGTGGFLVSPGPKIKLKEGVQPLDVANRLTGGAAGAFADSSNALTGAFNAGAAVLGTGADLARSGIDAIKNQDGDALMRGLMGLDLFNLIDIEDNISLRIGNFMYFPSVVITDVSSEHGVKLDAYSRKPIEISVTVTFRTFMTPKAEDLSSIIT